MTPLFTALRLQIPFLVAGFLSFLFSVWLYFVADEKDAGIFVGLWVPSIHSLGTLLLSPTRRPALVPVDSNRRLGADRVGS
ncbi:MAG: hypothetical protein ABIO83_03235 [Ilumatobacteraceae bacterium]